MNNPKIISVVGARPNFIKMKPIINSIKKNKINNILVHTGQHYDQNMSEIFFKELMLPKPDYFMGIGSGTHTYQTAEIMINFENICDNYSPDLVIVAGDVNSTLACALVSAKKNIPVAHIESGLRSFDRTMPEEINRIITDSISEILFVTEKSGVQNLIKEGIDRSKIHFVGNTMIDSLINYIDQAKKRKPWLNYGLTPKNYCLVTMHRPSNVDDEIKMISIIRLINQLSDKIKIIFPIHPRTAKLMKQCSECLSENVISTSPLSYLDFLGLMSSSRFVLTDSGGIQEESTYLEVQCVTLRENTERPITITEGTNHLAGTNTKNVLKIIDNILTGKNKKGSIPEKWDGKAGDRIVKIISEFL